ncbi:phosphoprotein [Salem virus]|uniref:Phosphoprotein n=1 Tax=Salem virus TaxID=120499 RepID=I6UID6_9MONO|nr:phosphoprotein [Salem virus]AFM97194.1 phosphoprotein [Salem virus]
MRKPCPPHPQGLLRMEINRRRLKRGLVTDVSTQLSGILKEFKLNPGAIPFVPKSDQHQEEKNAGVGNVRLGAPNVEMTEISKGRAELVDPAPVVKPRRLNPLHLPIVPHSSPNPHDKDTPLKSRHKQLSSDQVTPSGSADYNPDSDASKHVSIDEVYNLLITILEEQRELQSKVEGLYKIQGEIDQVKKNMLKVLTQISIVEGHLSTVMLAIPSSGKDPDSSFRNPDLRPVLGRDKARGVIDLLGSKKVTIDLDKPTPSSSSEPRVILKANKDALQLEGPDQSSSNSSHYIVGDPKIAKQILKSLITSSKLSPEIQTNLLDDLSLIGSKSDLQEFHRLLIDLLSGDNGGTSTQFSQ